MLVACSSKSEKEESEPTHKLSFEIEFDSNLLLDKYDVYLLVDGKKAETLSHGSNLSSEIEVSEGIHTIGFEEVDGKGKYKKEIEVLEDTTFKCTIKTHSDSIDVMNLEINGVFVEDEEEATTEAADESTEATTEAAPEGTTEIVTEATTEAKDLEVITVKNNEDFKKLVKIKDPGDPSVEAFANKYSGRTIEFDGAIYDMMNHGDYDTRFDVLINPCKFDENTCSGPNFKFVDVNYYDMNISNSDSIEPYKNYHFVCEVGSYDSNSQLFELYPISMKLLD